MTEPAAILTPTGAAQRPGFRGSLYLLAVLVWMAGFPTDSGALAKAGPDVVEIREWADQTFASAVEANRISGAVISVVRDGEILFERGYGQADVVSGQAADAHTTRVRIGSTTKTFTATLIAELIENGVIASVDDPVNQYLTRVQIPDNDGVEITLRHLLTHTAGFEDRFYFIGASEAVEVPASAELIESLRPEFARPAGEKVVYSNFGVAVLGYVIEDLTGQGIADVMQERIFDPLDMTQTSLLVSIDEPDGLARPGLMDANGLVGPTPFTAINPAVAQTGSIVSTAHDMALFMNAQLGFGSVVSDYTIGLLQTPLAENSSDMTGLGMVFFLDEWAGQSMVSHGGNWAGFHTWMLLLPEVNTGVFISLLSEAAPTGLARRVISAVVPSLAKSPSPAALSAYPIINEFMAEFFGPRRELPSAPVVLAAEMQKYEGIYRADRRPFKTSEALSSLVYFGADVLEVTAAEDGLYLGGAGPWRPAGEGRFVLDVPSRPMMAFKTMPVTGQMVLVPDIGIYTFSRISAWSNPKIHAMAIHLLLPLTVLGLLFLPASRRSRYALLPATVGMAGLVMLASASLGFSPREDSLMSAYFAGHPERILCFVIAANVQWLASLLALLTAGKAGRNRISRWFAATIGLLGLVVALILFQYNAIGFHRL